jgi:hypothetical protein
MFRVLSGFERILLFFGLLLLFAFVAIHVYRALYSHAALRWFCRSQSSSAFVPVDQFGGKFRIPDFRLWSEKRIAASQARAVSTFTSPLDILNIHSIDLGGVGTPPKLFLKCVRWIGKVQT